LNDAHEINYARDNSLPESIINQLRPRLDTSKHVVLLIGAETNGNRKGILRYEIRYALRHKLPIILAFKGYSSDQLVSDQLWQSRLYPKIPAVLRAWNDEKYCLVSPFTRDILTRATSLYSHTYLPLAGYNLYWN
jgi:hypothetical protein